MGMSRPRAATRSRSPDVGLPGEEELGDRVLGSGVGLADQDLRVEVEAGALGMLVRERGHAHGERAERPDQGHQLVGMVDAFGVPHPRLARAALGVAAQREDVADAHRRQGPHDTANLRQRVSDGREVGEGREQRLAGDPLGDPDGPVAGRATGAVGHRDERRVHLLDPPDRLPQHRLAGVVPRREELEADARHRPGEGSRNRPGEVFGPRHAGADRHTGQGTLASPEWAGVTRSRAGRFGPVPWPTSRDDI